MYITRVEIENIRSIKHLVWEIDATNAPGWHVILGDNGSGKSTFIRTVAVSIIGLPDVIQLREDWVQWIPRSIVIRLHQLALEKKEAFYNEIESFIGGNNCQASVRYLAFPNSQPEHKVAFQLSCDFVGDQNGINRLSSVPIYRRDDRNKDGDNASYNWKLSQFHVSYGPFRRFTGGDEEDKRLYAGNLLLARHLSAFNERTALTEGIKWLRDVRFEQLEGHDYAGQLLTSVKNFVNQDDFLPFGAQLLEVTSAGVAFQDGNGNEINVEEMSDGYRSVLSLTFELLRQLSIAYGNDIFETHEDGKVTVKVPGVVQIDEVDAHLHPTWQKRIGFWFREHFPQMQFIVTTHSPLVCQAAEKGSIFLLPRPGTEETGRMLEGEERDRLIYGNILDAYSTEAFGNGKAARSDKSQEMLAELSDLNRKEIKQGLSDPERERQEELRAIFPTESPLF